jgi:hypothetical protein
MLLARIQENIVAYKKWLQSTKNHPRLYRWESLQCFQANWNLDDPDPVAMYDRSLYNTETRRIWQTENWQPKRMMLEFWRMDPLTVRLMFNDLFNETKDVEGRAGRFLFGCDELLREYKKANFATIENNHYHGDFRMIGLYLAFNYPEYYAPYDLAVFQKTLILLGGRDIPGQNDIGRYFKVMRTLMTFLEKDGSVGRALQAHLEQRRHYMGKTLLLADDFCHFVAEN